MTAHRTDYFLQIFKTIGAPLVESILAHAPASAPNDVAQNVAGLLTKSVQMGIDLGALVELEKQGEKAESARLALTGLAGEIVGQCYQKTGVAPDATTIDAVKAAMRTVMDFSNTFEASPEAAMRMDTAQAQGQDVDQLQSKVQVLGAFVPVAAAAARFSFDQPPAQLVQAVYQRLSSKIDLMTKDLTAGSSDSDKKVARALLAAAAKAYVSCHDAEVASAQMQNRPPSQDKLWQNFDAQLEILQTLSQAISGIQPPVDVPAVTPAESAPPPPEVTQEKTPQIFSAPIQPPSDQAAAAPREPSIVAPPSPPEQLVQPPAPPASSANPMSFFAAKPVADAPAQPPPPPAQPSAPPAPPPPPVQEPPPAPSQEAAPLQLDEPSEQAPPPAQPVESEQEKSDAPAAPVNPMSFFTAKKRDDSDEDGA